jgi:hypothetical protein
VTALGDSLLRELLAVLLARRVVLRDRVLLVCLSISTVT